MANFRMERLFVMLDEPVPGLNHFKAIDPEEFAWHGTNLVADQLGIARLDEFTFAPFQKPRWHSCAEGLETVNALLDKHREWRNAETNPFDYGPEVLDEKITILTQLQSVLQAADSLDRRFYLAAKDLA